MRVTLEQWLIFKTIVDEGSYANAADMLNKSQSSISYAMQQMSQQLATPVLEQQGRKAVLTEAGHALYRHAELLLRQADTMENIARNVAEGIEASITLAIDALAPQAPLFAALQRLAEAFPRTRVKVLETTLSGTDEALLNGSAQVAIMPRVPPGFLAQPLTRVTLIPVASKEYSLGTRSLRGELLSESDLRQARQVIIRDSGLKREQNTGWLGAEKRWTFSHFSTSTRAVKAGLGFAFLPEHYIAEELQAGHLVRLNVEPSGERVLPLSLVQAPADANGPAVTMITKLLIDTFYSP